MKYRCPNCKLPGELSLLKSHVGYTCGSYFGTETGRFEFSAACHLLRLARKLIAEDLIPYRGQTRIDRIALRELGAIPRSTKL